MPRRRMMDMRMMDGRNPYGSAGGYVTSRRPRSRRDRGMESDYGYEYSTMDGRRRRNARGQYMSDRAYEHEYPMHRDYEGMPHERDYGSFHEERGFKPVEAMGYFTGYYGGGDDYARGREDYRYDMRYDGNYPMRDYRYDYAGDYGEKLTKEEMEHWRKKLDKEVGDEQSKHFFKKENIEQKARQMGVQMREFDAEELALASYMLYSDYCKSLKPYVGQNMDVFVKMGEEFLTDPDSEVKGGEKLALYFDMVSGEDD